MPEYDACRANLALLATEHSARPGDRNEATTRLQLIDRLFFDCLGWQREDVIAEESQNREYADYTFLAPRRSLIVEAKREGTTFELPEGHNRVDCSLASIQRDNAPLAAALAQVARYCQERGVRFAAVSNGHQLVAFVPVRHDGTAPLEGRALVFPSFAAMQEHFLDLWNALSKPAVESKRLLSTLLGHVPPPIPPKLSASIARYPGVRVRNVSQADLKTVSELVLEDLARNQDLEPQFLAECYCASGALSEYSAISADLLRARYAALFTSDGPSLATTPAVTRRGIDPQIVADNPGRRPVLLLGDRGVGKTIFLRKLIRVDAQQMLSSAVTLYIDLGTEATLTPSLHGYVVASAAQQLRTLHGYDIEERNTVRGIYNAELRRFATGIHSDLRETDPAKYTEKELEFLERKLSDRSEHLKVALEHLSRGRGKQIVFFLDNADQREDTTQQQAFLVAQELAAQWPALVFLTLRPETFHRSQREGALSGYHPRAFTIAPPRVDLVVQKRLAFGLKIARGEISVQTHPGTKLRFKTLEAVILAFMESLRDNPALNESIENISAGNVRLALDLIQDFFGSGHVDTAKIVDIFRSTGRYQVPLHEFLRAVIYGENQHFDPSRSRIANLFDVSAPDGREHFLAGVLLSELASWTGAGQKDGFVEAGRLYDRMQAYGFDLNQIDAAVLRCGRARLLEVPGRTELNADHRNESFRATAVGAYHVSKLCRQFTYVDAVVVDTPILSEPARLVIREVETIGDRLQRAESFVGYLDTQWEGAGLQQTKFRWPDISSELRADFGRARSGAARQAPRGR